MTRRTIAIVVLVAIISASVSSAWAFVVTDPATTARNAVTAVLQSQIVQTLLAQHERLQQMARRLSAYTNLDKFAAPDSPRWGTHRSDESSFSQAYTDALAVGDADGAAYLGVSRPLVAVADAIRGFSPRAREAVLAQLATLNLADATAIAGTHQAGLVRSNGRAHEEPAIAALEAAVIDPSDAQSATAVLDKISGAVLIETRQKQARLQLLTALAEQLLVDNKRARDTEAAVLNMRLRRLHGVDDEGGGGFLAGAADDLRTWRQP
jgi:hypothetical protein